MTSRTLFGALGVMALCIWLVTAAGAVGHSNAQTTDTATISIGGRSYDLHYSITDSSVTNVTASPTRPSIVVNITSGPGGGTLTIQIPRYVLDAKNQTGTGDDDFMVFVDDVQSAEATQASADNQTRTLSIPFDLGAKKIEIVGTVMQAASTSQGAGSSETGTVKTPEFGAGTAAAILFAITIVGVVAVTRYGRLHSIFRAASHHASAW